MYFEVAYAYQESIKKLEHSLQIQLGEAEGIQSTAKSLTPLSVEGKQSYAVAGRENSSALSEQVSQRGAKGNLQLC